jgi:hypothetical protein
MPCAICGSAKTVKSHIVPRSLFHAMKRPGKQLIGSLQADGGYKHLQSGYWDSTILCIEHEARLAPYDDYGATFCKSFLAQCVRNPRETDIDNPNPTLLVQFASACVWRFAASRGRGKPAILLGPYATKIANSLFHGEMFTPLLLISRHGYNVSEGKLLNIGSLPFRYQEEGIHFWRFIVCGLIFDLKMDNRSAILAMKTLSVNDRTRISIIENLSQNPMRDRHIAPVLLRMLPRSKRQKRKI